MFRFFGVTEFDNLRTDIIHFSKVFWFRTSLTKVTKTLNDFANQNKVKLRFLHLIYHRICWFASCVVYTFNCQPGTHLRTYPGLVWVIPRWANEKLNIKKNFFSVATKAIVSLIATFVVVFIICKYSKL